MAAATITSLLLPAGSASADPSANTWYRLRTCESSNNYSSDTGNGHYGAYQFDVSTWRSVGGSGLPSRARRGEQDARALILYRERGWQPWQCASILGLHEDRDAGSGRIGDIHVPTGGSRGSGVSGRSSSSGIPAFPGGLHWYTYGETGRNIKTFQDQMHKRGFFPVGTGQYGPNTERTVKQLQRLNGLVPNGLIGPNTWRLAWTGKYSIPVVSKPVVSKPVVSKPVVSKPVVSKPVVSKPVVTVASSPRTVRGPTVGLATTGNDLARLGALGICLLALGVGLVFAGRRRGRRTQTS